MNRMYPEHPVVGVGAVIIRNGKILLEKRSNEPSKGKWTIPGGLVELGESIQEAVIRETQEETCLEVENPQLLDVVDYIERDEKGETKYHFVIADYYLQTESSKFKAASDADELRWVPFNEVERYELTQSFEQFFQRNRERLEKLNYYP